MSNIDWEADSLRASTVFTPSAPINSEKLFRGRYAQVKAVVDAINQVGRHAILFGGRGVGKTSLARVLRTKLRSTELCVILNPFVTCDSSDDFNSIWRKVFIELRDQVDESVPDDEYDPIGDPNRVWTPYDVKKTLTPYTKRGILYIVIDEFDKVEDPTARQLISDTIKLFSDHTVEATLILIGVADDATGLIDDHRSIDRCMSQIAMPRMPWEESKSIIENGLKKLGMEISVPAEREIVGVSKGLPTYVHLLGLHSARIALESHRKNIDIGDVKVAIKEAVSLGVETIRNEYEEATFSPKQNMYADVLLACALAHTDEHGRFSPNDLIKPLRVITGNLYKNTQFTVHLQRFCTNERGYVLRKTGREYRWRYQFTNPLLQPYVIMKGIESEKVKEDDIAIHLAEDCPLFKHAKI